MDTLAAAINKRFGQAFGLYLRDLVALAAHFLKKEVSPDQVETMSNGEFEGNLKQVIPNFPFVVEFVG